MRIKTAIKTTLLTVSEDTCKGNCSSAKKSCSHKVITVSEAANSFSSLKHTMSFADVTKGK